MQRNFDYNLSYAYWSFKLVFCDYFALSSFLWIGLFIDLYKVLYTASPSACIPRHFVFLSLVFKFCSSVFFHISLKIFFGLLARNGDLSAREDDRSAAHAAWLKRMFPLCCCVRLLAGVHASTSARTRVCDPLHMGVCTGL